MSSVADETLDRIMALAEQEDRHYRCVDYMALRRQRLQPRQQPRRANPVAYILDAEDSHTTMDLEGDEDCIESVRARLEARSLPAAEQGVTDHPSLGGMAVVAAHQLVQDCAQLVTDHHDLDLTNRTCGQTQLEQLFKNKISPRCTVNKSPSAHCVRELEQQQQQQQHHQQEEQSEGAVAPASQEQVEPAVAMNESFAYWRQLMFDWACMVVDTFAMDRDYVAICFKLMDRFVAFELGYSQEDLQDDDHQRHPGRAEITREDYQLYTITCLFLAVKIMEPYPRKISLDALVEMSRGFYSDEDIECTEQAILTSLGWHLHPPTPLGFARLYAQLLFPQQYQYQPDALEGSCLISGGAATDTAWFDAAVKATCATLTEIAVSDASFVSHPASLTGMASLLLAIKLHHPAIYPSQEKALMQLLVDPQEPTGLPVVRHSTQDFARIYHQLGRLYSA